MGDSFFSLMRMNSPDYSALAQVWLQSWQQQMAGGAAVMDPSVMQQQMMQMMGQGMPKMPDMPNYSPPARHEKVAMAQGAMRLLDAGSPRKKSYDAVVLCIPSLINRYHILDLYPERSLVRYLDTQGVRPFIIDWGAPGVFEQGFACADYIEQHLYVALDAVAEQGLPIYVLGHCMGGVLALGLSQLQSDIEGQILLSTPWDFQAEGAVRWPLDAASRANTEAQLATMPTVPGQWVQLLFHAMQPAHFAEKWTKFATMNATEQQHFMAVEAWLNDVVPLSSNVARECLIEWPQENTLMGQQWQVDGEVITPSSNDCPTLLVAPQSDSIVPPACTMPLADVLPNVESISPEKGHISMMVGAQAKATVWEQVVEWVKC